MTTHAWIAFQFLLGEWVTQGGGSLVFQFDLQGHVLLRRGHVEFPALPGQPAFARDNLMVIYPLPSDGMQAISFDNEGHVLKYSVGMTEDSRMITLVSEPLPSSPRYRTTYIKMDAQTMTIRSEIAPPGQLDDFTIYTEETAARKSPSGLSG
jgi:hypothetical protein